MSFIARLSLLLGAAAAVAADDQYIREIQKWRQQEDDQLRSAKSPLLMIGRFKIEEGESTLGSQPEAKILLPERAPGRVGAIIRHGAAISLVTPSETSVAVNDRPASGSIKLNAPPPPASADRVAFGDFTFGIRPVGEDFYLFLVDKQSKFLQEFKGKSWFPIHEAYRVTAHLIPYNEPKARLVADTSGSSRTYMSPGILEFQMGGQTMRLEPLIAGDELLVLFRDKTSGKETYGGGRFVEAAMPKNGQTMLDFNKAYNPYCAFDPYASCPVPPKDNRLAVRVHAGETYKGHY